jgi:oligosaccharide repeat unit polymerase
MVGLSYLSFSLGFFIRKRKGTQILNQLVGKFNIKTVPQTVINLHIFIMLLLSILIFVALTEKSGFGLSSWLREPRIGYQQYRRGFGHLYVLSLALMNFIYLYILFFKTNSTRKLVVATGIFVFILYFYGAKGPIIYAVFEAVVFYNFFIKKIRLKHAVLMFAGFLLIFILLYSIYRPADASISLHKDILSYASYYNEGRRFFADFEDEFEYAYGEEYISSLWMYVPRAFYPNKPYSYGVVKYVIEHYYPDAGKKGHTPAFAGPIEEYLNFGIIGIIIIGFMRGYISALFYSYFLRYRNFVGFVLLSNEMGFSVFPVMEWPLYKILWYVLNIVFLLFHKQLVTGAIGANAKSGHTHVLTSKN